ncbi:hypothetical protein [uncultured Roseobacter sp.]|uniref:hypothetical protein n=1 Tax=uncultured Roseobacter sp. TaxID=114847 RepID=UPI00261303A9|nr:hypothetical protein [uncultured Roseobacter sp.]
MFATAFLPFFTDARDSATAPPRRVRKAPPLFIGDAVQPWAGETLLLSLLREDAADSDTRNT